MNATHIDLANGHLLKFENKIPDSLNAVYVDLTTNGNTQLPSYMVQLIVPAYMQIN